uniref:hypothetical protein n=1 Tax=Bacillus cytotoxicus TaxID=580165 RepID=UPI0020414424
MFKQREEESSRLLFAWHGDDLCIGKSGGILTSSDLYAEKWNKRYIEKKALI